MTREWSQRGAYRQTVVNTAAILGQLLMALVLSSGIDRGYDLLLSEATTCALDHHGTAMTRYAVVMAQRDDYGEHEAPFTFSGAPSDASHQHHDPVSASFVPWVAPAPVMGAKQHTSIRFPLVASTRPPDPPPPRS